MQTIHANDYGAQTAAILDSLQAQAHVPLHLQIAPHPAAIAASAWDALLTRQAAPTPFMHHAYLHALHTSHSAVADTGWQPCFFALWQGHGATRQLLAACPLYLKTHSYGEYVFDWAWARAYAEHGYSYYPKAVIAVPFTPVPGSRMLAVDAHWREALLRCMLAWCSERELSSLHLLLGSADDAAASQAVGMLARDGLQFHWQNRSQTSTAQLGEQPDWQSFEDFLASLTQDKRKKIRAERRKVADAGIRFRWLRGAAITPQDWAFFYVCYERTYLEHGNAPYLTPDFFANLAQTQPEHWLMFMAEQHGRPVACSLIGLGLHANGQPHTAYGRYWGALQRVDCLHFETCYYQPLQWCIDHGVQRFEGGAQGEHKMARALLPTPTRSAHWLTHSGFADAVSRFLQRESAGVHHYAQDLATHSPFKAPRSKNGTKPP